MRLSKINTLKKEKYSNYLELDVVSPGVHNSSVRRQVPSFGQLKLLARSVGVLNTHSDHNRSVLPWGSHSFRLGVVAAEILAFSVPQHREVL